MFCAFCAVLPVKYLGVCPGKLPLYEVLDFARTDAVAREIGLSFGRHHAGCVDDQADVFRLDARAYLFERLGLDAEDVPNGGAQVGGVGFVRLDPIMDLVGLLGRSDEEDVDDNVHVKSFLYLFGTVRMAW